MSFFDNCEFVVYSVVSGFLLYNVVPITSYLFNLMTLNPGTGRVFSRSNSKSKKGVFIDTNVGRIRLPFIKLPSPDTEIYFFSDSTAVEKSELVEREIFNNKYEHLEREHLKRYEMGIITDILKPNDFKNKKRICGFISSLFEDYIYLFVIEDELIDYKKLFEEFDDKLAEKNDLDAID